MEKEKRKIHIQFTGDIVVMDYPAFSRVLQMIYETDSSLFHLHKYYPDVKKSSL